MAKVRGGLFGLEAKGQYAKTLNYQGEKGCNVCTRFHKPGGSPTDLQTQQRDFGVFVKNLPNFYYADKGEVMPNWKSSLRIARVHNTFLGQLLRQTRKFESVIYGTEGIKITKIKVVYKDGFIWDTHTQNTYRDIVPLWTRFTWNSSAKTVTSWQLRGWRRTTGRAFNTAFTSATHPKTGFQYAIIFVKTQTSEEIPIMSYVFDWTQPSNNRKGGDEDEGNENEKEMTIEK